MSISKIEHHKLVSKEEWLQARKELLKKEKEFTHIRDSLSRERRDLPWVLVEKEYIFDTPEGKKTLRDLFAGRSQLIIYHFMFGPDWEEGCVGCSFLADHFDGALPHLTHHDISFVVVSRTPLQKIEAFKKRMGWRFRWVSSNATDFNYDFDVSFMQDDGEVYYNYETQPFESDELHGTSVFYQDEEGHIYHTYSCYARGDEALIGTYNFLDLTPKGRNENGPSHTLTDWVKHHDKY